MPADAELPAPARPGSGGGGGFMRENDVEKRWCPW